MTRDKYEEIWELKCERKQLRQWLNEPIMPCEWNEWVEEQVDYANARIKEINKILKEMK